MTHARPTTSRHHAVMSCRRAHRRNFLACRYAAPTWCCQELTCSYTKQNRIDYESDTFVPPSHERARQSRDAPPLPGRTGLQYKQCQDFVHRPKFICPKQTCRRMVKPFYDPGMWDYRLDSWGSWSIVPRKDNKAFAECQKEYHIRHSRLVHGHETDRDRELREWTHVYDRDRTYTEAELAMMRQANPEAWQQDIVTVGGHQKRCPSCGDAVIRVGSAFRIPARKDDRAWKRVEKMVESEDMVAKFSHCMTFEEHDTAMQKLQEGIDEGRVRAP
ncbi:hypothetical protein LTR53_006678 [Teratosphaeriaceae sp. CCFEE 6253]|nr:hypothetical protein LTR53_006678 [Teratosphaeriaceae sp. CCFEE 6253]